MCFIVVTPEYKLRLQVSLYNGPIQDAKDEMKWCQAERPALLKEKDIVVNSSKIIAVGHSTGGQFVLTIAICPTPTLAIVDFYGCKYLNNLQWSKSLSAYAQMPDSPPHIISKIFDGPYAITSVPMFISGKPNLADPRRAWYNQQIKSGTSLSSAVPDSDYERIDATTRFSKEFPPTYFPHGKPDVFFGHELSARAHEALEKLGVETELVLGMAIGHAFDLQIRERNAFFGKYVVPALDWFEELV